MKRTRARKMKAWRKTCQRHSDSAYRKGMMWWFDEARYQGWGDHAYYLRAIIRNYNVK